MLVALRVVLTQPFGLIDDEAYYWLWSHALSLSYMDNTPGAGWYLFPWRVLVGEAAWQIRLYANLMALAAAWALWMLVRQLFPKIQLRAAWLVLSAPFSVLSGFIWVHDVPLALFLALTSWQLVRALQGCKSAWLWAGLFMAMALIAKLTALLFLGLAGLWILLDPAGRKALRGWQAWVALGVALLGILPVLIWNAQHDWITFRFQGSNAFNPGVGPWRIVPLVTVFLYFAAMAGVPLLLSVTRLDWKKPEQRALITIAGGSSLLFFGVAIYKTFLFNWAAMAVLLLIPLGVGGLMQRGKAWHIAQALQSLVALTLVGSVLLTPVLVKRIFNLRSAYVWPELRSELDARLAELPAGTLVAGNRFQEAAQIAYLYRDDWESLPGGHPTPALGLAHWRLSHFSILWPESTYENRNFLLIVPERIMAPEALTPYFCTVQVLPPLQGMWRDHKLASWNLVYATNFVGRDRVENPPARQC